MRSGRGFERLITFADAVVAIALTLLVLPLVEIPAELGADSSLADVFTEHRGQIGGFLLSFVVIWVFWTAGRCSRWCWATSWRRCGSGWCRAPAVTSAPSSGRHGASPSIRTGTVRCAAHRSRSSSSRCSVTGRSRTTWRAVPSAT